MQANWRRCFLAGIAAGVVAVGAACVKVEPPCILVAYEGPCVLKVEYGDGREALEREFRESSVFWFQEKRDVVRVALADGEGKEMCSADGEEFAERYRRAPRWGGRDYGLRLSADGVEWMTREEFLGEANALRERQRMEREEKDRQKDWLTRELDARRGRRQ